MFMMMSEKRFILKVDKTTFIIDKQENHRIRDMYRACDMLNRLHQENITLKERRDDFAEENLALILSLNKLKEENELLRTQLIICQQSKSDDGRFQVWEVPPIPKGARISFTTNDDGD